MKYFMIRSNKLEQLDTMSFTCVHDAIMACVEQFEKKEITLASVVYDDGNTCSSLFVVSSTASDRHLMVAYDQKAITLPYYEVSAKLHDLLDDHDHYYVAINEEGKDPIITKYDVIDDAIEAYAMKGVSIGINDVVMIFSEKGNSLGDVIVSLIGKDERIVSATTGCVIDRRVLDRDFEEIKNDAEVRLYEMEVAFSEQHDFEQAEAELEKQDYSLRLGTKWFDFKGYAVSDTVYSILVALLSSGSVDNDDIVIVNNATEVEWRFKYRKNHLKLLVQFPGEPVVYFYYNNPVEVKRLREFLRKKVIL